MATKTKEQKLFDQHAKILADELKLPGNEICADCGSKGPRWASTNIGIYVCIRCSGIHRSLGTHISKVKSTNLDKWAPEQIEYIRGVGNIIANRAWEAKLTQAKPNENDTYAVEQFIKEKYVRKRWLDVELLTPEARKQFDALNGGSSSSSSSSYSSAAPSYSQHGRDIFGARGSASSSSSSSSGASARSDDRYADRSSGSGRSSSGSSSRDYDDSHRSSRSDRSGSSSSSRSSSSSSSSERRSSHRSREPAAAAAPAPAAAVQSQPLVQFDTPTPAATPAAAAAAPLDAFGAFVSAQSTPTSAEFFGATAPGGTDMFAQPTKKATKDDIMSLFESAPTQPAITPSSQYGAQVYQHAQSLPAYGVPMTQYYAPVAMQAMPGQAYAVPAGVAYGARPPQGYPAVAAVAPAYGAYPQQQQYAAGVQYAQPVQQQQQQQQQQAYTGFR